MNIRILPSALKDIERGRKFYDRQGQGLGAYFIDTIFSEIDSLLLYAGIHRKVGTFHRLLTRRFPFAAYYRVIGEQVQIWRVLDCRQNPVKTKKALE